MVMDNCRTHKTAAVKRWFLRHPGHHVHFTRRSSSRLNRVERFFAAITEKRFRGGVLRSVAALKRADLEYLNKQHDKDPRPFAWTADAEPILKPRQENYQADF